MEQAGRPKVRRGGGLAWPRAAGIAPGLRVLTGRLAANGTPGPRGLSRPPGARPGRRRRDTPCTATQTRPLDHGAPPWRRDLRRAAAGVHRGPLSLIVCRRSTATRAGSDGVGGGRRDHGPASPGYAAVGRAVSPRVFLYRARCSANGQFPRPGPGLPGLAPVSRAVTAHRAGATIATPA